MDLYALKLIMGFQQPLIKLSPFWSIIKQAHSPNTLRNKDLTPSTIQQPCGRHPGVYLMGIPMMTQHHQKSNLMISRQLLLIKIATLSTSRGRD